VPNILNWTNHHPHFHCLLLPSICPRTTQHNTTPSRPRLMPRKGMPVLQPLASTDPRLNTNHPSILRHKEVRSSSSSWSTDRLPREPYNCNVGNSPRLVHAPGVNLPRTRVTFDKPGTPPPPPGSFPRVLAPFLFSAAFVSPFHTVRSC